ncbi:hypothetical protein Lepto7376_1133 [[Leptolyngbya] sp. PCC 7376]|uniref:hypothetical protein n=1 Tax=[Leptolyngbya] sp. PCC 7376 TaxID=111781 RepID=UPI00029EEE9F|nr:hypothetical protein [[Leptolyngbya] sp. PCC 7376]AFY37500.1 hypothetical protein Lepto7376_1133 [[Leptolyngbya] sp. PCC 7376]
MSFAGYFGRVTSASSAIANIIWQRIREEGAKHSRWVDRTQLCYVAEHQGKQHKYWITFKGHMFETGHPACDSRGDRYIYDQLYEWWQTPESPEVSP